MVRSALNAPPKISPVSQLMPEGISTAILTAFWLLTLFIKEIGSSERLRQRPIPKTASIIKSNSPENSFLIIFLGKSEK